MGHTLNSLKGKFTVLFDNQDYLRTERKGRKQQVFDSRSYCDLQGIPHVRPIGMNGLGSQIIVCPYCWTLHLHGMADGHRTRHCSTDDLERAHGEILDNVGYIIDWEDEDILNFLLALNKFARRAWTDRVTASRDFFEIQKELEREAKKRGIR